MNLKPFPKKVNNKSITDKSQVINKSFISLYP